MGLFDFWKKKHTAPSEEVKKPVKPQSETSAFKGDLSFIQDTPGGQAKETQGYEDPSAGKFVDTKDSPDSYVFMTFAHPNKYVWYCLDCGTRNEFEFHECIVCGRKK